MLLKTLTLTQFRAFEQATFSFHPGMNLLVGVNGVGKSSALDALKVLLSRLTPQFTAASKTKSKSFDKKDINYRKAALTARLEFEVEGELLAYITHKYRHEYGGRVAPLTDEELDRLDRDERIKRRREQEEAYEAYKLPEQNDFDSDPSKIPTYLKKSGSQPIALYFSTSRALPLEAAPSRMKKAPSKMATGGQAAAFSNAFESRLLNLKDFAEWWLAQKTLAEEDNDLRSQNQLEALQNAVTVFLETCTGLEAVREPETTLIIYKEEVPLDISQLSDGERSVLALVFDLTRRLYWANPSLENPLTEGKGVVLIDELDLHLHPVWQRDIVKKLTTTFPKCQFIATTHSPIIIGEVKSPGLSLIVKEDEQVSVIQDGIRGYGLASNWILEHIMGTASRNASTQAQINLVEEALEEGELDLARQRLEKLKTMIQGYDDEVTRLEASIYNLDALADDVELEDEMDSEE